MLDDLLMEKKGYPRVNSNILQINDNVNFKHNKHQNFKASKTEQKLESEYKHESDFDIKGKVKNNEKCCNII